MTDATLIERLDGIQQRIDAACARCGRRPDSVKLLAVSKTFGPDDIREALAAGLTRFGENRVQEAKYKIPMAPGGVEWHLVGHLQGNKVKEAVRLFPVIHSVDSIALLDAIDTAARAAGRRIRAFAEVNVSGERSKFGMLPDSLPDFVERANQCMNVDLIGLMTLPPFTEDPEGAREFFVALRELRDRCTRAQGVEWELSMGMSNDFEVAIEEGTTWIRVGRALFGERRAPWKPSSDIEGDI